MAVHRVFIDGTVDFDSGAVWLDNPGFEPLLGAELREVRKQFYADIVSLDPFKSILGPMEPPAIGLIPIDGVLAIVGDHHFADESRAIDLGNEGGAGAGSDVALRISG